MAVVTVVFEVVLSFGLNKNWGLGFGTGTSDCDKVKFGFNGFVEMGGWIFTGFANLLN